MRDLHHESRNLLNGFCSLSVEETLVELLMESLESITSALRVLQVVQVSLQGTSCNSNYTFEVPID